MKMKLQRITSIATIVLGILGLVWFSPSIMPGNFIASVMGIASLCAILLSLLWLASGIMLFTFRKWSFKLAMLSYLMTLLAAFFFSFLLYYIAGSVGNRVFHPFSIEDFKMVFPYTFHNKLMPFSLMLIPTCVIFILFLSLSKKHLKKEKEEGYSGNTNS
jgi:hypothetical protein